MRGILWNTTWPVGHFILRRRGWERFTMRQRRHWWVVPWYRFTNPGECTILLPYRDAIRWRKGAS